MAVSWVMGVKMMALWLFSALLFLLIEPGRGFRSLGTRVNFHDSIRTQQRPKHQLNAKEAHFGGDGNGQYNDDAFGLVLLTGLLVCKDLIFCGCFVAYSFVAFNVRRKRVSDSGDSDIARVEEYFIPPVVAINALITASILFLLVDKSLTINLASAPAWESGPIVYACFASLAYGLLKYNISSKKES